MSVASDARLSPEQKLLHMAEAKKRAARLALLKKDISATFATAEGRRALRWIMGQCGYQRSNAAADPTTGDPMSNSIVYNEGRRIFYLQLRQFIHHETLAAVETQPEDESVDLFS